MQQREQAICKELRGNQIDKKNVTGYIPVKDVMFHSGQPNARDNANV